MRLVPRQRRELTAALREPNTFLAEDMTDVLAILQTLKKQPDNTGRRPDTLPGGGERSIILART